jgi:hypothetical protein
MTIDSDRLLHRLRECVVEESDWDTLCGNCQATLTVVDRDVGECTQCSTSFGENEDCWEEQ